MLPDDARVGQPGRGHAAAGEGSPPLPPPSLAVGLADCRPLPECLWRLSTGPGESRLIHAAVFLMRASVAFGASHTWRWSCTSTRRMNPASR